MRVTLLAAVAFLLVVAAAATAAPKPIPGIRSPSGNIKCLYVPRSGALGLADLICSIGHSAYGAKLQRSCHSGKAGVDWHGFELTATRKATVLCSGGILYDPQRQKPTYSTLPYGRTWRQGPFTCVSRLTGITCRSRANHGLFISRLSYRLS
jgi:hypothetical protein